jgi:hypothetical protein
MLIPFVAGTLCYAQLELVSSKVKCPVISPTNCLSCFVLNRNKRRVVPKGSIRLLLSGCARPLLARFADPSEIRPQTQWLLYIPPSLTLETCTLLITLIIYKQKKNS